MSSLGQEGVIYGITEPYVRCDLCGHLPEFSPGSKWSNRAKVIGGCLDFVVHVAVLLGLGSVDEKATIT